VTRNLHAALQHLRRPWGPPRRIWADAVCINQDDATEKGGQVQMMRDIYRGASRTVVWLGDATVFTPAGFTLIPRLLDAHRMRQEVGDGRPLMSLSASDREMYGIPSYLARDWLALLCVFDVAYFRRMWIVQEVVVSRTVDVMCGHDGCTWDELIAAISACIDLQLGRPYDVGMTMPIMATARARKFYSCGLRWGLLELLVRHRGFESTDQRDKVFALLGLVEDDQLARLGVKPNYEKGCTVADAYVDLARRVLEASGRLDLLSVSAPVPLAQGARGVELDLPSWVPD